MSMSQAEIEALMNGLDIDDSNSEEEQVEVQDEIQESTPDVDTNKIEELLAPEEVETKNEEPQVEEKIEDIVVEESKSVDSDDLTTVNNDDIDKLLNEIEQSNTTDNTSIKEVIEETSIPKEAPKSLEEDKSIDEEKEKEIVEHWTSSKIDEGVFPLPADKDTRVVTQLTQVANDSEEKVSQIFDVLSLSLDNNNLVKSKLALIEEFIKKEEELLNKLHLKFPDIEVFSENIETSKTISKELSELKTSLDDEDMQIFQAMELMQFNDINRQKIERVMSVIRKLSLYLNNLFEDDGSSKEIAVAKHIHGDDTEDLIGEDLEKLIDEYTN